jgi:hypothetical protein
MRDPAFWATAALALGFLTVGVVCLIWPVVLQQYALRIYRKSPYISKWMPFAIGWVSGSWYLWMLRLIGIFSLLAGILGIWATFNP